MRLLDQDDQVAHAMPAIVDTGASAIIYPKIGADALGLDWQKLPVVQFSGAAGTGYGAHVRCSFLGITSIAPVYFADIAVDYALIGLEVLQHHFDIQFDGADGTWTFEMRPHVSPYPLPVRGLPGP